jgi:hypothetical protein
MCKPEHLEIAGHDLMEVHLISRFRLRRITVADACDTAPDVTLVSIVEADRT